MRSKRIYVSHEIEGGIEYTKKAIIDAYCASHNGLCPPGLAMCPANWPFTSSFFYASFIQFECTCKNINNKENNLDFGK